MSVASGADEFPGRSQHVTIPFLQHTTPLLPNVTDVLRTLERVGVPAQAADKGDEILARTATDPSDGQHYVDARVLAPLHCLRRGLHGSSTHVSRITLVSRVRATNAYIYKHIGATPVLENKIGSTQILVDSSLLLNGGWGVIVLLNDAGKELHHMIVPGYALTTNMAVQGVDSDDVSTASTRAVRKRAMQTRTLLCEHWQAQPDTCCSDERLVRELVLRLCWWE